jgi:hypothetical protein
MLAYHTRNPYSPARSDSPIRTQFVLSMGVALIEASEHVLATAKHLLGGGSAVELSPIHSPFTMPLARQAASLRDDDRGRTLTGSYELGPVCESIVENAW